MPRTHYTSIEADPGFSFEETWNLLHGEDEPLVEGWYRAGNQVYILDDGGWLFRVDVIDGDETWTRVYEMPFTAVWIGDLELEYVDLQQQSMAA